MVATLHPPRTHTSSPSPQPTPARSCRVVYLRRRLAVVAVGLAVIVVGLGGIAAVANRADAEQPGGSTPGLTQNGTTRYVVRSGDSLWSIAATVAPDRDPRTVVDALERANTGLRASSLQAGQLLLIPPSA
jgi:Tfp pilus assembly protein FimV